MTGLLSPKSSETEYFFCMMLVVHLGPWNFLIRHLGIFFFPPHYQCLREVLSSQIEEPQKKSGAPLS